MAKTPLSSQKNADLDAEQSSEKQNSEQQSFDEQTSDQQTSNQTAIDNDQQKKIPRKTRKPRQTRKKVAEASDTDTIADQTQTTTATATTKPRRQSTRSSGRQASRVSSKTNGSAGSNTSSNNATASTTKTNGRSQRRATRADKAPPPAPPPPKPELSERVSSRFLYGLLVWLGLIPREDDDTWQQSANTQTQTQQTTAANANKTADANNKRYTSYKHRATRSIFHQMSGASSRGGFETDKNRYRTIWAIALFALLILIGRAYYLQVINSGFYQEKGDQLITRVRTQPSYRGVITDRNGQPLAVSAPLVTVYFSPYDYARSYYQLKEDIQQLEKSKDTERNQKRLAKLRKQLDEMSLTRLADAAKIALTELKTVTNLQDNINVEDDEAVAKVLPKGDGSHYFPLMNKVTPEMAEQVLALDFRGIFQEKFYQRYYPQSHPNSQLVGFMGQNANDASGGYQGRAGIELKFNEELSGKDGKILVFKDARQNSLKEIKQLEPEVAGKDIQLTIDSRLQYILFKELEKAGRKQQALWSSGMIVDVHTGEVLALSTWPSFNANNLGEMTGESQRNRALLDSFEPGSVMKPFTVAAALDSGKFSPRSLIDTSPGYIRVKGYTINDHGNLGTIGFRTLLKKSSNVASAKVALSLPADGIASIQKRFGFGTKTALQFPGEQAGKVNVPTEKQTARRVTISYGYGVQVTLAQLAQAYATLGAGGVRHPLSLIKSDEQPASERVIDHGHATSIVEMMESVTLPGGTGTKANIDGYRVAGKTGTSRRVDPEGGYYKKRYRTVFAGIAPVSNPRLVTVILVEDPQKKHYAGDVAAPVFHNVMKEALRLYNVPLDKPLKANKDKKAKVES